MHTYLIKRTPFFAVNSLSDPTPDPELGNACGISPHVGQRLPFLAQKVPALTVGQRLLLLAQKAFALTVGKKGYNHG
jgi:hypothetical protein